MKLPPLLILLALTTQLHAQPRKTENLIIIGLDGVRWQEIFTGVDSSIMNDPAYTREPGSMKKAYWDNDVTVRRRKLLPFFWGALEQNGQLYGNRNLGNKVNVSNPYNLTGPGFTETLVGFADSAINGNRLILGKNTNVLEFLNNQKAYKGRVAAFAMSELFDFFLNKWRTGLMVNCDTDKVDLPDKEFQLLNEMEQLAPKPFDERPDLITYFDARTYLKLYKPKVLYFSLGETDDYAHAGSYDFYIGTLHSEEHMIASIWDLVQSMPEYKDKTTIMIACDHGRGARVRGTWTDHGPQLPESGEIFILTMGPDTKHLGEVATSAQLYQGQMAATIARFLGLNYTAEHPVLPPIETMLAQ